MVVFGHAYVLSGRADLEPLAAHTGVGGFGELGVSIFFVISGFLVTMSFDRLRDTPSFLANRCLRILPALAVATVLTAFVLGPLVTALPAGAYLAKAQTWLYPVRNVLLYPVTYALPGVFQHNPYPGAVNGSLWTLRLEFSFYLLIPAAARLRLLTPKGLALGAAAALAVYLAAVVAGARAPAVVLIAARNLYLFAAGAALFAWRDRAWVASPPVAGLAALVFLAALPMKALTALVAPVVLPLVVVGLALRPAPIVKSAARFGDLSYGVYIYAFPVQQAWMAVVGPERLDVPAFTALTLAVVLPLAALSWWLVERPALGLKEVVRARLRPGRPATPIAAELPEPS
jgi:peptidoglycan/LPS O-acetylase OafA/YrhL